MKKVMSKISILMVLALAAVVSCQDRVEPVVPEEPIDVANEFQYDGQTYKIKSAVRYTTGSTVELWLSPVANLYSIGEVVSNGNYVVLSINKSSLNGKDIFRKDGSFIRYNDLMLSYGMNGLAFIENSFTPKSVSVAFEADALYSSDNKLVKKTISGTYEGAFVDHSMYLDNQWAYDRVPVDITGVHVYTETDAQYNTTTTFHIYDDKAMSREAVKITVPEASVGQDIVQLDKILSLQYDGGKDFKLVNSANILRLNLAKTGDNVALDMDFACENEYLAASYLGECTTDEMKPNHIAVTMYEKDPDTGNFNKTGVERQTLRKLFVETSAGKQFFKFAVNSSDTAADGMIPVIGGLSSSLTDGAYHYEAAVRFAYTGYSSVISAQSCKNSTIRVHEDGNGNYKVVFRASNVTVSSSKAADIEVFWYGQAN